MKNFHSMGMERISQRSKKKNGHENSDKKSENDTLCVTEVASEDPLEPSATPFEVESTLYESGDKHNFSQERKYKCDECISTFKKKAHLDRHMMSHTGERPFACDLCSKSYRRKDKLKIHSNRAHPNIMGHNVDA